MSDLQRVGPITGGAGSALPFTAGIMGAQRVGDACGRYMNSALEGRLFTGCNVAAQAVSVALATTYTGLCLSNPAGSTKNLVLLGGQFALSVAPAAIAPLFLIGGYAATGITAHTTPLASPGIQNGFFNGQQNSVAKLDSACTIVNPGYLFPLGAGFTAAALPSTSPGWIDFGGSIILPPGAWAAFGALTAVTGFGAFLWEEIPAGLAQQ